MKSFAEELRHIRRALDLAGGSLGGTARLLGIHRNTLREKLRRVKPAMRDAV